MQSKSTKLLEPGEIIARSVRDKQGNVLVHEGVEVTRTLIRVLERRGVEEVAIHEQNSSFDDGLQQENKLDDSVLRQRISNMEERLALAFQERLENPAMAALYQAALGYLSGKIMKTQE